MPSEPKPFVSYLKNDSGREVEVFVKKMDVKDIVVHSTKLANDKTIEMKGLLLCSEDNARYEFKFDDLDDNRTLRVELVWFQAGGVIPLTTLLEVTRKLVDEGYQYISNENRSPFNTKYAIVEEWIHPIKGSASVVQE